jgi:TonB family protein
MQFIAKTALFLLAMSFAITARASSPMKSENGSGATYHYDDWRKQPPQKHFDVAPAPAAGMHAFISRLDYPASLRRQKIGGVMRVRVDIDASGQLQDVRVVQSIDPLLDRIVIAAVRKTRWTPALKSGAPVAAKFSFPLTFTP